MPEREMVMVDTALIEKLNHLRRNEERRLKWRWVRLLLEKVKLATLCDGISTEIILIRYYIRCYLDSRKCSYKRCLILGYSKINVNVTTHTSIKANRNGR